MNIQFDYEFAHSDIEKVNAIRKEVQPCAV
jgi:hypothetical protein